MDHVIRVSFHRRTVTVEINDFEPRIRIYELLAGPLALDHPPEFYNLLTPSIVEFDQAPVRTLFAEPPSDPFFLVPVDDLLYQELFLQAYYASLKDAALGLSGEELKFLTRLDGIHRCASELRNAEALALLLSELPFNFLERSADLALAAAALRHFREVLFAYDTDPRCRLCGAATAYIGNAQATRAEHERGVAFTQRFRCAECGTTTRTQRHTSLLPILRAGRGRTDEGAVLFAGVLTALGLRARLVWSVSDDRTWVEFFLSDRQAYVCVDPESDTIDQPRAIAAATQPRVSWIIAVGHAECVDVTLKYFPNRRNAQLARGVTAPELLYTAYTFITFRHKMWNSGVSNTEAEEVNHIIKLDQNTYTQQNSPE
jgi:hypothetical protein